MTRHEETPDIKDGKDVLSRQGSSLRPVDIRRSLYDRVGDENFKSLVKDNVEKDSTEEKANNHINGVILKAFKDKPR